MSKPHIWIDADSCPSLVKDIVLQASVKNSLNVTYVANRNIPFSIQSPLFSMVICPGTEGAADDYIYSNVEFQDIVITRDIPLANRLIQKNITTLNDRGLIFTPDNVKKMLRERELSMMMSAIGVNKGARWDSYGKKEAASFANCFYNVLQSKLSQSIFNPKN